MSSNEGLPTPEWARSQVQGLVDQYIGLITAEIRKAATQGEYCVAVNLDDCPFAVQTLLKNSLWEKGYSVEEEVSMTIKISWAPKPNRAFKD